ncbi:hypothetical protein [Companilactobacillus formosensis]|uniref:hypothetical protein n=1 Tax=Companilactobacillus formosensis TaxID=1617889 RepID=UPI000E65782C|nr:hypothetical protein [Companilactobacillus formosensis]
MKLAKTVIVSGLLFSSVLGGVNISSITAMAADQSVATVGENNTSTKDVKVIFVNVKDGSTVSRNIKVNKDATQIKVEDNQVPEGYILQTLPKEVNITKDGEIDTAKVNVIKSKRVNIKYIIDGKQVLNNKDLKPTVDVAEDSNEVRIFQLQVNPYKYEYVNKETIFTIKNNSILVNLKSKQSNGVSKPQTSAKPAPSHRPSAPRYTIQRVRITFVDQNSKDLVGYKQVTGKASFSTKIEAPKGYSFTNAKDATIKFDKKGNKDIKIFVKKMTSAPVKHEGIVTTTNGSYKRLYTLEGKMITNRALGVNSKWYTDQYATINGEKMYRVATNEWVKASDVL